MPVRPDAPIEVSAFSWVPPFAAGLVRDLRVRWALEEAGLDYRERLYDRRNELPEAYYLDQPFGQVPCYSDGDVRLFESGAIVLHIAQQSSVLMPIASEPRARAIGWVFAALNSIEPMVQELAAIDSFHRGQGWTTERRPQVESSVRQRLSHLAEWMGDKPYLEERFTAGDLMMVSVLRIARHTNLVDEFPVLKSYVERCTGRPAFERALAAQLAPIEATYAQIKGERA